MAHPEHDAVLDVEQDFLLLAVVPDEGVQRVTVRHPADEPRVGGQRYHRIPLDTEGEGESSRERKRGTMRNQTSLIKRIQKKMRRGVLKQGGIVGFRKGGGEGVIV